MQPYVSWYFPQFGGVRPAVSYYGGRVAVTMGAYGAYRKLDWPRVRRLVFVCSGNVCRSPYASGRARSLGVAAISCGIYARDGAGADSLAIRKSAERLVSLETHRSLNAKSLELTNGDLVLAAEPFHARALQIASDLARTQVTLLGLWSESPSSVIPDPYGTGDPCFEFVFGLIDQAVKNVVRIMSGHQSQLARESSQ